MIVGHIGTEEDISEGVTLERKLKVQNAMLFQERQKEKKHAVDLEEERNKLQVLLDNLPVGIFTVNALNGKVITVNPRGVELLGRGVDPNAKKQNYSEVYSVVKENGTIYPSDELPVNLAIKTGKPSVKRDIYIKKPDGSKIAIKASGVPVKNKAGKVVFATVVFDDISKEKEIDKIKDEFVSVASHELRTPLTAIDGLVSMILDGEYGAINDNLKEPLSDVGDSSERLIRLVNELLNVSRIQAGRLEYILSEFSLAKKIKEIVGMLGVIAKEKNITLKMEKITDANIQADEDKFEAIMNNIVGNSLKFTDKGGVSISAKKKNDVVEIYVKDTGIGIAKEDQVKLFSKFEQLKHNEGRPAGTGLGLYVAREMVRKMGGDAWLKESKIGKGSTFVFSVPIAKTKMAEKIKEEIEKESKENPNQKSDTIKKNKKLS